MASKNKRKQTFKEEYSRSWDFIKPSRKGENHARCTLCSADFSIAASGRYDITQHIATANWNLWSTKYLRLMIWIHWQKRGLMKVGMKLAKSKTKQPVNWSISFFQSACSWSCQSRIAMQRMKESSALYGRMLLNLGQI